MDLASVMVVEPYYLFLASQIKLAARCANLNRTPQVVTKIYSCCPAMFNSSLDVVFSEFNGEVEYSCKVFAKRKERLKLSSRGEGPLVSVNCL